MVSPGPGDLPGLLRQAAQAVEQAFGLRPDEVAILLLVDQARLLKFVHPPELAKGGENLVPVTIPSLASQALQRRQAVIENDVPRARHVFAYEGLFGSRLPIQKMLSLPLIHGQAVLGVIQVSRRAPSRAEAGNDFTAADAAKLQEVIRSYLEALTRLGPAA